jgi:hypothetical protein
MDAMSTMTDLRTASEQLARDGWNHSRYEGCYDAFPPRKAVGDIPADVDCAACQAIKRWFDVLAESNDEPG